MGKVIMVMGTASSVGKSIVVLSLCRLLTKMGYQVAPFKAQNITDRFNILENNRKIATSSTLAAIACHRKPHTNMNQKGGLS